MSATAPLPVSFSVGWTTLSAGLRALPAAAPTKIGVLTPLMSTLFPVSLPGCCGSNHAIATPAPARSSLQSLLLCSQSHPPFTVTVTVPSALVTAVAVIAGLWTGATFTSGASASAVPVMTTSANAAAKNVKRLLTPACRNSFIFDFLPKGHGRRAADSDDFPVGT